MEKSNFQKLFPTSSINEKVEEEINNMFNQTECKVHKRKTMPLFFNNKVKSSSPCCPEFEKELDFEIIKILSKYK